MSVPPVIVTADIDPKVSNLEDSQETYILILQR